MSLRSGQGNKAGCQADDATAPSHPRQSQKHLRRLCTVSAAITSHCLTENSPTLLSLFGHVSVAAHVHGLCYRVFSPCVIASTDSCRSSFQMGPRRPSLWSGRGNPKWDTRPSALPASSVSLRESRDLPHFCTFNAPVSSSSAGGVAPDVTLAAAASRNRCTTCSAVDRRIFFAALPSSSRRLQYCVWRCHVCHAGRSLLATSRRSTARTARIAGMPTRSARDRTRTRCSPRDRRHLAMFRRRFRSTSAGPPSGAVLGFRRYDRGEETHAP